MKGTAGNRLFRVAYLNLSQGRRNVTALLGRSGYTSEIPGLAGESFLATVTVDRRIRRGSKTLVIDARSGGESDRVMALLLKR